MGYSYLKHYAGSLTELELGKAILLWGCRINNKEMVRKALAAMLRDSLEPESLVESLVKELPEALTTRERLLLLTALEESLAKKGNL